MDLNEYEGLLLLSTGRNNSKLCDKGPDSGNAHRGEADKLYL